MQTAGTTRTGSPLGTGATDSEAGGPVRALQRSLRALGYLARGIDGVFGTGTARAVEALQWDLLHNGGRGTDGAAPVAVSDYNRGRIDRLTGVADGGVMACVAEMMADPAFPKVPESTDPAGDNRRILESLRADPPAGVPLPFLLAILRQETGLRHYCQPSGTDGDRFVVVGLDRNLGAGAGAEGEVAITSRGYGLGQYTLFHHPPTADEVADIIEDPHRNLAKAVAHLRAKFDGYVNGATPGTRADDRIAEAGDGPLRECRPDRTGAARMADCRACVAAAGTRRIVAGQTPFYPGAAGVYRRTKYYRGIDYDAVPVRARLGCDWPYAARRYNGSGVNSYNYQVRILQHLAGGGG